MGTSRHTEYGKKMPLTLGLLIPVTLMFAVYYYVRVLLQLNYSFDYYNSDQSIIMLFYSLFLFVLFLNYMLTLFWLYSGNRRSWARIMRLSLVYIALVILQMYDVGGITGDVFNLGPVVMLAMMIIVICLMMLKPIRDYYTPPYFEKISMIKWLLFIFWIDPIKPNKIAITGSSHDVDT